MNGLELARGYFEEFGKPMLEEEFADILPYIAVGFTGSGSEHYGFDDEISRDHDYEPGFCIFLPNEDIIGRKRAFQLERAYLKLPAEYAGVKRLLLAPVGGSRNGVFRTAEFYERAIGSKDGELSLSQWLTLPDYALCEAVNGEIYFDNYGEVSGIRCALKAMPRDIRLKRIAGNLLIMGQSGQYNLARCLKHGEPEAAQLACNEFINASLKVIFLLRERYMPYYKWSFRALRQLDNAEGYDKKLSILLIGDNRETNTAEQKIKTVEEIAACIIAELRQADLTDAVCADLERHAYSVNDKIADPAVRNMHILAAIN